MDDDKLNPYFQPASSLPAQPSNLDRPGAVANQLDINNKFMRSAITGMHLRNFNFSAGTGGTIVLGGAVNGNGYFVIKDALGNTIVTGNNQGLTVTGGNILVKNSDNTTIIDTDGIVSTANFQTDHIEDFTTRNTTSTSYVPVPGGTLSTFILPRAAKALVGVIAQGYNINYLSDESSLTVACIDTVNGTLLSFPLFIESQLTSVNGTALPSSSFSYNFDPQAQSLTAIVDLSAGTHTMNLQYKVEGAGTATLVVTQASYVILGQ